MKYPARIPGRLSDELFDKLQAVYRAEKGHRVTPWLHVEDGVSRGTISPMEAYDALALGYVPVYLYVRESYYADRL